MRYRKLTATGDYSFGHQQGDFFINSPAGVAQAVLTRMNLYTGEWFLDITDGMPWKTEVLGKYTLSTYDAVIKDRILSTPGVNSILAYSSVFDPIKRAVTVSVTIDTIYGTQTMNTTISDEIPPVPYYLNDNFLLDVSILA